MKFYLLYGQKEKRFLFMAILIMMDIFMKWKLQ
jgi:hypothetical protein